MLLSNGQIRGETHRNGAWPGGEHPSSKARFPIAGAGCTGPFHTSPTNAATFVSRGCGGYTRYPSPEPRTQRLTRRNTGPSLSRPQRGFVLSAKLPPKEQPEEVDARPTACVRFLRRRGPAGLRSLDAVVSAAVSASALLCLRLYLQLHHRPLLLFRFLAELLRVVVETHAGLLLTVFLHLA